VFHLKKSSTILIAHAEVLNQQVHIGGELHKGLLYNHDVTDGECSCRLEHSAQRVLILRLPRKKAQFKKDKRYKPGW
jgi:hypothetical protein